MSDNALIIRDVHKVFNRGTINEKIALNGVNLTLNPGDFVTIIGGNGAGKSTTLNAIAGVWPVDYGKIIVDGTDITGLPEHKRAPYLGRCDVSHPRRFSQYHPRDVHPSWRCVQSALCGEQFPH